MISFTPRPTRASVAAKARRRTSTNRFGPYGKLAGVAEVDEVLVREVHQAFVQDGQTTDARIEHPYRPPIGDVPVSLTHREAILPDPHPRPSRAPPPARWTAALISPPTSIMSPMRNAQKRSTIAVPMTP